MKWVGAACLVACLAAPAAAETRPASDCSSREYPWVLRCTAGDEQTWSKYLDTSQEHALYARRMESPGLEHLVYLPDLRMAALSHIDIRLPALRGTVLIDENLDGVPDRQYLLDKNFFSALKFFARDLPRLLRAAGRERDPRSFVYGALSKEKGVRHVPILAVDARRYRSLVRLLEEKRKEK